jgi:hypothetical protein
MSRYYRIVIPAMTPTHMAPYCPRDYSIKFTYSNLILRAEYFSGYATVRVHILERMFPNYMVNIETGRLGKSKFIDHSRETQKTVYSVAALEHVWPLDDMYPLSKVPRIPIKVRHNIIFTRRFKLCRHS